MGRLVLARALLAEGDTERASALVREASTDNSLSADVEKQVLERYSEFLSRPDHKARMEKRLFALDHEAALRAARRLGAADLAITQARIALNRKARNAKKLLEAVPADARRDPAYLFARAHLYVMTTSSPTPRRYCYPRRAILPRSTTGRNGGSNGGSCHVTCLISATPAPRI